MDFEENEQFSDTAPLGGRRRRRRGQGGHDDQDPPGAGAHAGGPRRGGLRGGRGGGRGAGRGRAQRGDIRAATLILLAEEPMYGYQIMQAIAERTGAAWRPSPGAIYPTIAQLEDEGLVAITKEGGRKLATLTEEGRTHIADSATTKADPFSAMSSDGCGRRDLRSALEDVQTATRIVAKSGYESQIAEAHQILAQARKSIFLLLAEGPLEDGLDQSEPDDPA